jgi:succinoglycan biosynthesis transport protein ExoP
MRLAFWRAGRDSSPVQKIFSRTARKSANPEPRNFAATMPMYGGPDLRAFADALRRKKNWTVIPTVLAAVLSITAVNLITPRYKAEARILIDGRENVFMRPNGERTEERSSVDPEAVASQVQLLLSRDLARDIIAKNKLAERPEFDPVLQGLTPLKSTLALLGIGRDPFSLTPEERVLDAYYDRLTAYAVDKSRVIVIEFQSRDAELATQVANSIAEGYLVLQQNARQEQAKSAGQWLSGEIDSLRKKVADAESRTEEFRSKSSLFVGTNNTTLSNQQMGELNTQLNNARALKSDAESKSRLIKEMLQSGKPIEATEVVNSELIRRLSEQRVTLRTQLAEQSSTLLDAHPRIKELKAQLSDLDRQIRDEAGKVSRSLENDARIANGRVEGLSASLEQLKKQATSTNGQDVQLRALERESKAQRDLLESYLAKYREATARENIFAAPADGRIISRAIISNVPAYPKKLPIVLIATLATLLLSSGLVVTGELLRMTTPAPMPAPMMPSRTADMQPQPQMLMLEASPSLVPQFDRPASAEPTEMERLVRELRGSGEGGRKITVLGTAQDETITSTVLTLARLLAREAKVVVVGLSSSSVVAAVASSDPNAPGLADLMLGDASFSKVITRDRMSQAHLISAGRAGTDRAILQSPRVALALDALLKVYDHIVLDAGKASDLPTELLASNAWAVVVPEPSMMKEARMLMTDQLKGVGFSAVTMLNDTVQAAGAAPREVVAA